MQKQSAADWVESFSLQPEDCEYLANVLLEAATPWSSKQVALALLEHRLNHEWTMQLEKWCGNDIAVVYRPEENYILGQALCFPALGSMYGEVISERAGFNPDYGDFRVIVVACDDECTREFASALPEHALTANPLDLGASVLENHYESAQQLLRGYGAVLQVQIEKDLLACGDIVRLAGHWFPRDLLVEFHGGHLNLVEAALDVADGGPLTPEEIMMQLEIDEEVNQQLILFSLNYALQQDERFDEVGPVGQISWFLRSMQPSEIRCVPDRLLCRSVEKEEYVLTSELIELARQLKDEFSPQSDIQAADGPVQLVLTYPHWCAGTLPLGVHMAHIFPSALISPRIKITLIDAISGDHLSGWVVQSERFVSGLGPLYEKYSVPAGGCITLLPGAESGEVVVRIQRRNEVREWVRTVSVSDAKLCFGMSNNTVGVNYSEEQIVMVDDVEAVEAVWHRLQETGATLSVIVLLVFRELLKLNPQGTVHASTLYSAVNVATRTPPEPVFAELLKRPCYQHVGDAYWCYDPESEAGESG